MAQPDTDINEEKGFASRGDAMDAILASRHEELEEDVGEPIEEKPEIDAESDLETEAEDSPPDTKDESKDPSPDDTDEDEQTVELIVDGEKKTMKMSEVVRVAQKNMAADQRLAEAEEKRRKADEILEAAKADPQPDKDGQAPADPAPDEDVENLIAEKRSAYLHALNYGETEEQEQAMIEYEKAVRGESSPQRPTVVDTAKIKAEIKEELTGDQIRHKFNLPESQGGFGDVVADPDLRDLCYARIDKAIEGGADHTDWNTYADIANGIRDKFIVKKPTKPASDALEEKKMRKRKIDNLETISDSKSSDAKEQNPPSSKGLRGDVIADMAKTRPGQSNY